jgi:hypothetical protein
VRLAEERSGSWPRAKATGRIPQTGAQEAFSFDEEEGVEYDWLSCRQGILNGFCDVAFHCLTQLRIHLIGNRHDTEEQDAEVDRA